MTLGIVIVITLGVVAVAAIAFGRPLTLSYKGMKASVEQTAQHVQDIKQQVGQTNGDGSLARMAERLLAESAEQKAELAEIRAEQTAVKDRLDERTHVVRRGRTEPEDLAVYTQDRMHDILAGLQVLSLQVQTMWRFLQDDYQLPDLSTVAIPKSEEQQ